MSDNRPAKLPGLSILKTNDVALARWTEAVAEHLEVRNGARGNPQEKAVVQRDLNDLNALMASLKTAKASASPGDTVVDLGGGVSAVISTDKLVTALLDNARFKASVGSSSGTTTVINTTSTDTSTTARLETVFRAGLDEITLRVNALAVEVSNAAITTSTRTRGPVSLSGGWDKAKWPDFGTPASWLVWVEFGGAIGRTNFTDSSHLVIGDTVALEEVVENRVVSNTTMQWRGSSKGWVELSKMDAQLSNGTKIGDYGYNLNDLVDYIFKRIGDGTEKATISSATMIKDYYSLKDLIEYIAQRITDGTRAAKLNWYTVINAGVGADPYTFANLGTDVYALRQELDALVKRVTALEARP